MFVPDFNYLKNILSIKEQAYIAEFRFTLMILQITQWFCLD